MSTNSEQLTTNVMLRFYAPLAATSMLMMMTHSVVSGALARTADPVLALAAYSAAYSIGQIFEAPCHRMQQMGLVFMRGQQSFRAVVQAATRISAFLVLALVLLGWTPLSNFVFFRILGTPEAVYPYAINSLRFLVLWPIASTLRAMYQARIVLHKRTIWMTGNMLVRVALMLFLAAVLPGSWPLIPVGAVILVAGLGIEAVLALVVAKRVLPPLGPDPTTEPRASSNQAIRFFLPLTLAAMVQTLGRPVLTAALSRTAQPELALSGYYVAFSFAMIFAVPIYTTYHLALVFIKDRASATKVRFFVLALGAGSSALLGLCALPWVGQWLFGTVIAVPEPMVVETMRTMRFLAMLPIIIAVGEFFANLLTLRRHTLWVTVAKLINVAFMSSFALLLALNYPHWGAAVGAMAMVSGAALEAAVCYLMVLRFPDCRQYLRADRPVSSIQV